MKKLGVYIRFFMSLKKNNLNQKQKLWIRNHHETKLPLFLLEKSLKKEAFQISDYIFQFHPELIKNASIQTIISEFMKKNNTPEYILELPYGESLPFGHYMLEEFAAKNHKKKVKSLLSNNTSINKDTFDEIYDFLSDYRCWQKESLDDWKEMFTLFLNNKQYFTEKALQSFRESCIDLIDYKNKNSIESIISSFRLIEKVRKELCYGYVSLIKENNEFIYYAVKVHKRFQPNGDWMNDFFSFAVNFRNPAVLHVLHKEVPEIFNDEEKIEKLISFHGIRKKESLQLIIDSKINLNECTGIDSILEKLNLNHSRDVARLLFLVSCGVNVWDGNREKYGQRLLEHLIRYNNKSYSMFRLLDSSMIKEINEVFKNNEMKLGKNLKVKYRSFMLDNCLFA
jgi:hypothetical protein